MLLAVDITDIGQKLSGSFICCIFISEVHFFDAGSSQLCHLYTQYLRCSSISRRFQIPVSWPFTHLYLRATILIATQQHSEPYC